MIVLALDIAKTVTGWAIGDGEIWEFGVLKCPIRPPPGLDANDIDAGYSGKVGDWFRTELLRIISPHNIERAAIEKPLPGNITKKSLQPRSELWGQSWSKTEVGGTAYGVTHFLHGLALESASLLHRRRVPAEFIPVQTWRKTLGILRPPKSAANNRRWYKEEAIRQCQLRGVDVDQPDAAEAVCLGIHFVSTLGWSAKVKAGQLL